MATITVTELAEALDTTAREARKFLRTVTPQEQQPGKGGRWAIEKRDVRSLTKKFHSWEAEKAAKTEGASTEAKVDDPEVEVEDASEEPTAEDLAAIELEG